MANSIAAVIHIDQRAEWQWKTVDAEPRCGYLRVSLGDHCFAAMKCLARLIANCAIGILSVQAQSAWQVSQLSEQPKDRRKPDFTLLNTNSRTAGPLACSASGQLLAAAFENAIRVYDVHHGDSFSAKLTRTLTDSSMIHAITFQDSNILVSLAADGSIKTWNTASGTMLHRTSLDSAKFTVSAFATARQPVLATATLNRVTLWNYETGKLLNTFETTDSAVSALAFTPDGKLLIVGTHKGVVRVFDVATRKITRTIDLDSPIRALSANLNYIMLGYSDGTLAQLSFGGQTSTHEVSTHSDAVTVVAFGPQGEPFASGSMDGTIKIWNPESLKLLASLKGNAAISSIAFGPNSRTLISSTTNGGIEGWRLPANP